MTNASEPLFSRIPEHLFAPLAGPNRAVYSEVLLSLYPLFFEHDHHEVFPSRETVRAEIEERVARMVFGDGDGHQRCLAVAFLGHLLFYIADPAAGGGDDLVR